jgi:hypothetical protein
MITIDQESKKQTLSSIDYDTFGTRYKTVNNIYTFVSPEKWIIEKNLYFLLRNSIQKPFDQKYKIKPSYLSFDEYNTVVLAPLLMYINSVFSEEEFDLDIVNIPTFQSIMMLSSDKTNLARNLEEIDW